MLSSYVQTVSEKIASPAFEPLIKNVVNVLTDAENIITDTAAEKTAEEILAGNSIQRQLQTLLAERRNELQHGIFKSDTQKKLTEFKPIADQFNFIENITTDIRKTAIHWME
jgi:hypothetical protein